MVLSPDVRAVVERIARYRGISVERCIEQLCLVAIQDLRDREPSERFRGVGPEIFTVEDPGVH